MLCSHMFFDVLCIQEHPFLDVWHDKQVPLKIDVENGMAEIQRIQEGDYKQFVRKQRDSMATSK
jgi:hypothetical protein